MTFGCGDDRSFGLWMTRADVTTDELPLWKSAAKEEWGDFRNQNLSVRAPGATCVYQRSATRIMHSHEW